MQASPPPTSLLAAILTLVPLVMAHTALFSTLLPAPAAIFPQPGIIAGVSAGLA